MPKVTFADNDSSIEVEAGSSLHDACEAAGAPIPFSCTVGVCGTCLVAVEAGADNVNPCDDDEESTISMTTDQEGLRLACQLRVNGNITVRSVDA